MLFSLCNRPILISNRANFILPLQPPYDSFQLIYFFTRHPFWMWILSLKQWSEIWLTEKESVMGTFSPVILNSMKKGKEDWASLSISHDGPGAKITEKMAPGPYILKRTGSHFFRTGSHSQNPRKCNFKLFLNILFLLI